QRLDQGFLSLQLLHARRTYRSHYRYGLAVIFNQANADLRILKILLQPRFYDSFQFTQAEAGGMHFADERHPKIALGIDTNRLLTDFLCFERPYYDLIVRAEDIRGAKLGSVWLIHAPGYRSLARRGLLRRWPEFLLLTQ